MKNEKKKYNLELPIIVIFLILIFVSPLLFGSYNEEINWSEIFLIWKNNSPLIILFLINRFILVPKFLFNKKHVLYFSSVIILIAFISTFSFIFNPPKPPDFPRPQQNNNIVHPLPPPPTTDHLIKGPKNNPAQNPPFFNLVILSFLVIGFDTGLKISTKLSKIEQEKIELTNQNVENQLAFLKNQINPHFFMNTLNNIHVLVDVNSDKAKSTIIKLSKLMRYLLYDTEKGNVYLTKEIEFINSYIELMKLRFSEKVKINFEYPAKIPDKRIPPLLFTSLLENAFKHGVSYQTESYININLDFTENSLIFEIKNSKHKHKISEEYSGIGVQNSIKRFELLYGKKYNLSIEDTQNEFGIHLTIPI